MNGKYNRGPLLATLVVAKTCSLIEIKYEVGMCKFYRSTRLNVLTSYQVLNLFLFFYCNILRDCIGGMQ